MKTSPQRLRSIAPPTRDKIFIWSAVIAASGVMALLVRQAAITRFGTDAFTGNVLFIVFLILLFGFYMGFQSVVDDLFTRFQWKRISQQVLAVAVTPVVDETEVKADEVTFVDDGAEDKMLEEAYNDWLAQQEETIEEEDHDGTYVVKVHREDKAFGSFASMIMRESHPEPDGRTRIEEWEEEVYITANGEVYSTRELEEALKLLNNSGQQSEIHQQLITQHELCNAAHEELKEEDMKFSLSQIEFLCAYITFMMQPYLEADELQKLHHNAKIWTVHEMPPFTPVNLRSDHLTKEDLKHLGYNVGKFLRLQGGTIARFVKKVFEKPFEKTHVRTIEQKLRESKSTKERIPIHTREEMERLFKHFQRYGNINLDILKRA